MVKVVHTSGKRKTAIARATVRSGKGRIRVNNKPVEFYQPELARLKIQEPLELAGKQTNRIDINIDVYGGGVMGQAEATRTAIARGIIEWFKDDELQKLFQNMTVPFWSMTQDVKNQNILWAGVHVKRGRNHTGENKC